MDETIHIAIVRRVRKTHAEAFERALAEFASKSLAEPGSRGVHCIYPPPGSGSLDYGILRSFASAKDRDAFYETALYKEWLAQIEPMVEGAPKYRRLDGLEAWFRGPANRVPPRWKMALLTWIAVWPVSVLVPAVLKPLFPAAFPQILASGVIAGGIVTVLTWGAMPLLVKLAHAWLQPENRTHEGDCPTHSP
jgi:antibiotic biosynthesis monooxygenase (ABM) superfamily enzyme